MKVFFCLHSFAVLCLQYVDYAIQVLLPEIMIKIVMDLRHVTHDEADMLILDCW